MGVLNDRDLLTTQMIDNPSRTEESITTKADPLILDLEDDVLVKTVQARIDKSRRFFRDKCNLYARRERNEIHLFGRQVDEQEKRNELKVYEARYLDNALYEIESTIKPLAMSRLPDMIVTPGNPEKETSQTAKDITVIVDSDIKKRENRIVLGIGFKHLPVYFTGVIKTRWNPEDGHDGDYKFEVVHPDNIDVDETCPTNNADDMSFVSHLLSLTVQEVIMRFPEKKDEFIKELQLHGLMNGTGDKKDQDMASTVKIREVWFTWYKNSKTNEQVEVKPNEPQPSPEEKWERIEGVLWKYENCLLKKMRNPNFDYQGYQKVFSYDVPNDQATKREVKPEEMLQSMLTGIMPQNMTKEQLYIGITLTGHANPSSSWATTNGTRWPMTKPPV